MVDVTARKTRQCFAVIATKANGKAMYWPLSRFLASNDEGCANIAIMGKRNCRSSHNCSDVAARFLDSKTRPIDMLLGLPKKPIYFKTGFGIGPV